MEEQGAAILSAPHRDGRRLDRFGLSIWNQHAPVQRVLAALFAEDIGKDVVSRVWHKVKGNWDAWNARSLAAKPIIRLTLDGTVVRVRLDKKATSISLLVALGVPEDGQKVLLAVKNMGGESEAAWRALLDDLVTRGLGTPKLVIVDGAPGLENALAALWADILIQRCMEHKHRNQAQGFPAQMATEMPGGRLKP